MSISYEGFAYIKVEKAPHIPGLNRTVQLGKKKDRICLMLHVSGNSRSLRHIVVSGNEHIVRIAVLILTEVAVNLLAVLFLSACLNRDGVFILRTAA